MGRRSLRFEQLERRLLLAGDVKVAVSRGDLIVTGDQEPDRGLMEETIEIAFLGTSQAISVRGLDGTQLVYNGQTGTTFDSSGRDAGCHRGHEDGQRHRVDSDGPGRYSSTCLAI